MGVIPPITKENTKNGILSSIYLSPISIWPHLTMIGSSFLWKWVLTRWREQKYTHVLKPWVNSSLGTPFCCNTTNPGDRLQNVCVPCSLFPFWREYVLSGSIWMRVTKRRGWSAWMVTLCPELYGRLHDRLEWKLDTPKSESFPKLVWFDVFWRWNVALWTVTFWS